VRRWICGAHGGARDLHVQNWGELRRVLRDSQKGL